MGNESKILIFFVLVLSFFTILPTTENSFSFNPYTQQAQKWVLEHLADACQEEKELIANLFYWSYKRSLLTLKTQEAATKSLNALWFDWDKISRTRRNPSIAVSSTLKKNNALNYVQKFEKLNQRYQRIGAVYTCCLEDLIKDDYINNSLKSALEDLRKKARNAILLDLISSSTRSFKHFNNEPISEGKLFHVLKKFWHALPAMTINSFVEFDKKYVEMSSQCWDSFMAAHEQANAIWKHIETTRTSFYAAYYNALLKYLKKNNPDLEPLNKCFNQDGYIKKELRSKKLPLFI